ncbi:MAG: PAS domain S-box protein, partial [Candidatus Bathyarchaeota archaeon]|nr:PAS domain S-box protein [Candidatus Bathyarchaeota archaeon]
MSKSQNGINDNLLKNSKDAIIFLKGTTIINANQKALDFFEVKKEDFIGREIYEFSQNKEQTQKRVEKRRQGILEYYTAELQTSNSLKEAEVYAIPVNTEKVTSISIIKDVTEYNRLDRKYRTIFERSADLIFVTNASGVVFINPSGLEYLGLSSEDEILGKSTLNFIHPDYQETANTYAAMRRAGGTPPHQYRSKMVRKDGTVLDVEFNASFIMWDGAPSSLTIVRDISEQVRLENELMESKELLSGFIDSATDGFSIIDENMQYVMVNDTELKYSRRKREDFIGKHILEVFPELDEERYKGYQKVLETGEPVTYHDAMNLPDRGLRLSFSAFKIGNLLGIIAKDITKQAQYQRRLEALHSHASRLALLDTREEVAYWTMEVIRELLGTDIGTFGFVDQNKVIFREYNGDSLEDDLNIDGPGITMRAVRTGKTQHIADTRKDPEYIMGATNRERRTLSELDVPIKIDEKVVALINLESEKIGEFSDEDKRLVETLAEHVASSLSRIAYRARLTAIHSFAVNISKHTKISEIAEETLRFIDEYFDYPYSSFGEVKDNQLFMLYHHGALIESDIILPLDGKGITVKAVTTGKTQFIEDMTKNPDYVSSEVRDSETGEEIITISEIVVPIFEHEKVVAVINIESPKHEKYSSDVIHLLELIAEHVSARLNALRLETEKVRADQAMEMERLKTRFVSTATHELRTPLTSIKGYLELALSEELSEKVREYLHVADRSTDRLEALTAELLDQQRIEEGKLTLNKEIVDLDLLVSWVLEEVSNVTEKKNQNIIVEFSDEHQTIFADALRLGQVLVNLLDNASKYSPENSEITLQITQN